MQADCSWQPSPLVTAQPAITRQPAHLSLSIGATATFRVIATTTYLPLSYQWRFDDKALVNATNASLTLTNIQMTDAGLYAVAVSDGTGTTNSSPAILEVDAAWTKITSDPILTDEGYDFTAAHFGLGDATQVDILRIEWTSGIVQELYDVPVKQYLTVTEPPTLAMPRAGELYIQGWKGMACRLKGRPICGTGRHWAP